MGQRHRSESGLMPKHKIMISGEMAAFGPPGGLKMSKNIFDVEVGKIPVKGSPVILPKFSVHFYRTQFEYLNRFFAIGRLYRGYIGMMVIFYRFRFDLVIHYPDRELRRQEG